MTFLQNCQVPECKESKVTAKFILLVNSLCDKLKSKDKFGKHKKIPITLENFYEIEGYLMNGTETLKFLKNIAGILIIKTQGKDLLLGLPYHYLIVYIVLANF